MASFVEGSDASSETIGLYTKILLVTFHSVKDLHGEHEVSAHITIDHGHFADFEHAGTSRTGGEWEESVAVLIGDDVERVKLEVRAHHAITAASHYHGVHLVHENLVHKELALDSKGTLIYSVVALPIQVAAGLAPSFLIPAGFHFKLAGPYNRLVVLNVNKANVVDVALFGHRDPYVLIENFHNPENKDKHKSVVPKIKGKVHWKATHPVFNETFATLVAPDVTGYRVEIKNHHLIGAAGHLGHYDVPIGGRVVSGDFKLEGEPGDINLHSYHVPLELIAVVASGNHPFVAPGSVKVKTGEGFELPVWFLTPHPAEITVIASVGGTPVGHGHAKVVPSGVTQTNIGITPSRVLELGTHINVAVKLIAAGGAPLESSIQLTVGDE